MIMKPGLRKFVLTAHVTASVGRLGAITAYIALAITLVTSQDVLTVRGAYLAMEPIVVFVIIPLSLAALLTGVLQSLGSKWGLLRYWWVVLKLLLTIVAIGVLLEYTQSVSHLANLAAGTTLSSADLDLLRTPTHLVHTGGGLLVVLAATVLAMYKPWGRIGYGQRKQRRPQDEPISAIAG